MSSHTAEQLTKQIHTLLPQARLAWAKDSRDPLNQSMHGLFVDTLHEAVQTGKILTQASDSLGTINLQGLPASYTTVLLDAYFAAGNTYGVSRQISRALRENAQDETFCQRIIRHTDILLNITSTQQQPEATGSLIRSMVFARPFDIEQQAKFGAHTQEFVNFGNLTAAKHLAGIAVVCATNLRPHNEHFATAAQNRIRDLTHQVMTAPRYEGRNRVQNPQEEPPKFEI